MAEALALMDEDREVPDEIRPTATTVFADAPVEFDDVEFRNNVF